MKIVYQDGDAVVVVTPLRDIDEVIANDIPEGVAYEVLEDAALPSDRAFRNAWALSGRSVAVDMLKAQALLHEARRAARDAEFLPLDRLVTIPSEAAKAEAQRQAIRDKYAAIQTQIDAATTVEELKDIKEAL